MSRPKIPTDFCFRSDPGKAVALVGDFPSWKRPVPLVEVVPGEYRIRLWLGPGIYRYKFRSGESWFTDPARPVDVDDYGNSLVVVGGTPLPFLFAPDRRRVVWFDGQLTVHAEAEGPAPAHIWANWADQHRLAPLVEVGRRGERRLLRAELALPEPNGWFGFEGRPECYEISSELVLPPAPGWLEDAACYGIFVDRWFSKQNEGRRRPSRADLFYGGDLDGIRSSLDYLQGLGVDALVLTPLHPSGTPHRYDAVDWRAVDPALGGESALSDLVKEAHRRGLKVILDLVASHVHEDHPAFVDLLAHQQNSPHAPWFQVLRFPVQRRDSQSIAHYWRRPELPLLNLNHPEVQAEVLRTARYWADFGIDGLRLDAMDEAPVGFWARLRRELRASHPNLALLGEVVTDDLAAFTGDGGADVATDFAFRALLKDVGADWWERYVFHRFRSGPHPERLHWRFLDNHDTARWRSLVISHDRLRWALALLLFLPGPVWLTYGTELGLAGGCTDAEMENVWPERQPMPPLSQAAATETSALLRKMLPLRKQMHGPVTRVPSEAGLILSRDGYLLVLSLGEPAFLPRAGALLAGDAGELLPAWGFRLLRVM